MPEKTKPEKDTHKKEKNEAEKVSEGQDEKDGAWGRDQLEKSYYYDDAHGYEIYNPDNDDEDED